MGVTEAVYVAIVVVPSLLGTVIAIRYWVGNETTDGSAPNRPILGKAERKRG